MHSLDTFRTDAPYRTEPYNARNWGHPWHSLCSYHGKLKPSIAHFLVAWFTEPGQLVLDPLSGVGTIPLEARLQGRHAIGNDISPLAAVVTKAKLEASAKTDWISQLGIIEQEFAELKKKTEPLDTFVDFGYNRNITEYFHPDTLRDILLLRTIFNDRMKSTPAGAYLFSCFAHVLHGNRPYALSRRSHPLTPYAPSGPFERKQTISHLAAKAMRSSRFAPSDLNTPGISYTKDYTELATEEWHGSVDAIITSPPFVGSLRFHSQNWLRLWLAGWEPDDFKRAGSDLERKGPRTEETYQQFLEYCHSALRPGGRLILHTGRNSKLDMGKMIAYLGREIFTHVNLISENVETLERHGVRDKGGTVEHQFLLLTRD